MKLLRDIFLSLHSPLFYQRVFRDVDSGIGLSYLLKLLTLCWLLVSVMLAYWVMEARQNPDDAPLLLPTQILRKISPQFPVVVIEKGKMRVEGVAQPLTLYDPDTGLPLMIIDTSEKPVALGKNETQILITHSSIKMRYEGEDIIYEMPKEVSMVVDSGKLEEWANFMEKLMPYAPFIMLPFNVIGNLLGLSMRWLLMGAIAFVALKPNFEGTKFADCLRIAAYALTASTLLKMVMVGSGFQPFGAPEMVLLGVSLLYLFFAVSSVLRAKK